MTSRIPYSLFPVRVSDLVLQALYRLGDEDQQWWMVEEIDRYLQEGYNLFCLQTGILWERAYLEDQKGIGVCKVPKQFYVLERATWNYRVLSGVASVDIEMSDSRYQITQGEVYAYTMDKDGLRSFRKIRIPARDADQFQVGPAGGAVVPFMGDPLYGIPKDLTDVVGAGAITSPVGTGMRIDEFPAAPHGGDLDTEDRYRYPSVGFDAGATDNPQRGIPRRIPYYDAIGGVSCYGSYPYGIPRRVISDLFNTKIEFRRRPHKLYDDETRFEIPTRALKYVRFFAMWKALEKEGPGQLPKMAEHYKQRWQVGIERMLAVREAMKKNRLGRFGGGVEPKGVPPRPQLPWAYGRRVR